MPLWMSEDNLQALVLSIYMWVLGLNLDFRLGTKCLYWVSHRISPLRSF